MFKISLIDDVILSLTGELGILFVGKLFNLLFESFFIFSSISWGSVFLKSYDILFNFVILIELCKIFNILKSNFLKNTLVPSKVYFDLKSLGH